MGVDGSGERQSGAGLRRTDAVAPCYTRHVCGPGVLTAPRLSRQSPLHPGSGRGRRRVGTATEDTAVPTMSSVFTGSHVQTSTGRRTGVRIRLPPPPAAPTTTSGKFNGSVPQCPCLSNGTQRADPQTKRG